MVAILDRVYARKKKREGYSEPKSPTEPNVSCQDPANESWYCFVPRIVNTKLFSNGLTPQKGRVSVYTVSSFNIMHPDPEVTVSRLRKIYDDANSRIDNDLQAGSTINLLGISLGNVLSIRAAAYIPRGKLRNLVSIVGGGRLGLSAWDSILARDIVRSSELSAQEYEKGVSEFSPIHYTGEIFPEKIFARFGASDLLIPSQHGRELAGALEKVDCTKDIRTYPLADHCLTMFLSSRAKVF